MSNAVILVPWRSDGKSGRREKLWAHVQKWLIASFPDIPIYMGESPDGPFSRGAAINDAARQASEDEEHGDWEVAVIHDADNIADPDTVRKAIERVTETGGTVYPFSTYIYVDRASTTRILDGSSWMLAPEHHDDGFMRSVRYHHVSGVQVMHREALAAIGGYIELEGWGAEDQIVNIMLNTYSMAPEWLEGGAFHLWHLAKRNDPTNELSEANHATLAEASVLAGRPMELRDFLAKGGHVVP